MKDLKIKHVKVMLTNNSTDTVYLIPEAESPFPIMGYPANIKMEAERGFGVEWVRRTFGIEPEILDFRT